jgi:hypothetical protein
MKVTNVGSTKATTTSRRKQTSPGSGGAFADHLHDVAATADGTGFVESQSVNPMESIIAAQEGPDTTAERSRGLVRQYGVNILDRLDDLRHQVLAGAVSKERLVDLARSLRGRRHTTDDARLKEIIDEIELRAEVEIAKLTRDV